MFAFKVLQWLTFSARPLCLEEVAEVIAIDAKECPRFNPDKRFEDPNDILEICSSLISVDDTGAISHTNNEIEVYTDTDSYADTDDVTDIGPKTYRKDDRWTKAIIKLAHFSVKEYLVSDTIWHGPAMDYGLQEVDSNTSIAEDCLVYLLHSIQQDPFVSASLREYPLARYAAEYWFEHVPFAETAGNKALSLVQELFLSRGEAFVDWIRLYDPDHNMLGLGRNPENIGSPLYYASLLGMFQAVNILLERGDDVNVQGGLQEYPLIAASTSGCIEVVQLLLDRGANINAHTNYPPGNALTAASIKGHIEIVQHLLDRGADIDPNTGLGQNTLTSALSAGQEEVVALLIQNGADVGYARQHIANNSLALACHLRSEHIVRLLLNKGGVVNPIALLAALREGGGHVLQMLFEHGGDLNQKDIEGKAVCHYASANGESNILKLLMSRGSDLTVMDKQGRNCLHLADASGTFGDSGVVTMLLRSGFDPNSQDYDGWTPLHWAAKGGDINKIAILEEAGAKFGVETLKGWTPDDVAIFHGHKVRWKSNANTVHNVTRGSRHEAECDGCDQVCKPPNKHAGRLTNLGHIWIPIPVLGLYGL